MRQQTSNSIRNCQIFGCCSMSCLMLRSLSSQTVPFSMKAVDRKDSSISCTALSGCWSQTLPVKRKRSSTSSCSLACCLVVACLAWQISRQCCGDVQASLKSRALSMLNSRSMSCFSLPLAQLESSGGQISSYFMAMSRQLSPISFCFSKSFSSASRMNLSKQYTARYSVFRRSRYALCTLQMRSTTNRRLPFTFFIFFRQAAGNSCSSWVEMMQSMIASSQCAVSGPMAAGAARCTGRRKLLSEAGRVKLKRSRAGSLTRFVMSSPKVALDRSMPLYSRFRSETARFSLLLIAFFCARRESLNYARWFLIFILTEQSQYRQKGSWLRDDGADAQPDVEHPHAQREHEPAQDAPPPLVGGVPEQDLVLRLLLQHQTHDLVDAAQQPHYHWFVPRVDVHGQGHVLAVGRSEEVEPCVDVDQQEEVEGVECGVAVGVRWQDRMLLFLELELLAVLLPAPGAVLCDVDHDAEGELGAVVDDLQAEEDHHEPELDGVDVAREDGAVLQPGDEERQLQEDDCGVADDPVAVAEHAPQQQHEDGEDVEVGDLGLQRAVDGRQDYHPVDDGEHQRHHEQLLGLEALVEGQHRVVADHDRRVREEAQPQEVVGEGDGHGNQQQQVRRLPGLDGGREGDCQDQLKVGEVGQPDEVEDREGDHVGHDQLDEEGLEAELVRHLPRRRLAHPLLRLHLRLRLLHLRLRSHRLLPRLRLLLLGERLGRGLLGVERAHRLPPEVGLHDFLHDPAILAGGLLIQKLHLDVPETGSLLHQLLLLAVLNSNLHYLIIIRQGGRVDKK